jgi:hypothetical protein
VRRVRSRAVSAAVLTACSLCAAGPTALATRSVKIASHVSIKGKGLTFTGGVTSPNRACKRARKVLLYRTPALALGSATTNAAGHWKITVSGSAGITLGHFYAKLRARSEGTAGTIYRCSGAASKTIAYMP